MKYLALLFLSVTFVSNPNSNAQVAKSTPMKPTIIFVHGLQLTDFLQTTDGFVTLSKDGVTKAFANGLPG
jgi:hypothetical protein